MTAEPSPSAPAPAAARPSPAPSAPAPAAARPSPAPSAPAPAAARPATRVAWLWVLLSSLGIVAFAVTPYLTASLASLAESPAGGLAGHYAGQPPMIQAVFYAHVVGGGLALALGPLQFWRGLRERMPRLHRWVGRVALGGVAIGGVAGLLLAPVNSAGLVGLFGFGALAALWLTTGALGYRAIRRGDVPSHRAWMMRCFALSYGAVTLRIWLPLLIVVQLPFTSGAFDFDQVFQNAYAAVPFLSWLPNLVVAEWLIARRGLPGLRFARAVAPRERMEAWTSS